MLRFSSAVAPLLPRSAALTGAASVLDTPLGRPTIDVEIEAVAAR